MDIGNGEWLGGWHDNQQWQRVSNQSDSNGMNQFPLAHHLTQPKFTSPPLSTHTNDYLMMMMDGWRGGVTERSTTQSSMSNRYYCNISHAINHKLPTQHDNNAILMNCLIMEGEWSRDEIIHWHIPPTNTQHVEHHINNSLNYTLPTINYSACMSPIQWVFKQLREGDKILYVTVNSPLVKI